MLKRLALAAVLALLAHHEAQAFCGFYINGAGGEMFNNATQVVLMRQGTRTVLSMQNNYQGPPADFALVIPVPVVLKEADVKTLTKEVFGKVDVMGAPRLVEYWEQDPCRVEPEYYPSAPMAMESAGAGGGAAQPKSYGVKIEAQFAVGEYDITILSATESTGLDRYLRDQKYKIPAGAEPLLRPYVEGGSKFFVAKVNPKKVKFVNGMAELSPLRFHYDSDEFSLPIRLGLANAKDKQDLIVSILSPGQRYELANYKNATIPTNLDVKDDVRTRFGEFYAALFDRTVQQNPGAVITEYAWDAGTCDPCPGPQLDQADFATLGADVLGDANSQQGYSGLVLTRLHARYGKEGAPNDLVFKAAKPIVGGREQRDDTGRLEERSKPDPDGTNNFQGRYAIRHAWTGPVQCANPRRGVWGGPPNGDEPAPAAATNIAFAPRGKIALPDLVNQDIPEIGVKQGVPLPGGAGFNAKPQGCGCQSNGTDLAAGAGLAGLGLLIARRRRAKR